MKHFTKKRFYAITAVAAICTMLISQLSVYAAEGNNQGSYSHGSNTIISEDELKTADDIPTDYTVNTNTQGSAKNGDYTSLFNTEDIEDVNIDIAENNWNYLLQNANEKPNVLTNSVTINGNTVSYAAMKTKGNLTLSSVWNSDSDRFSFTVNFGKYIKKSNGYSETQNFYGLSKVAFNDIYGDASLMKEYLSYKLMSEMGVATPCYSLVNLYINGEKWGVYMMVESVDDALTQRTLGEKSDFLTKPESSGGDLVYNSNMDKYINSDGEFEFSSSDYPTSSSDPLYAYNGLWENDEDTFSDVLDSLPIVFKWMKTLNELSNSDNPNTDDYETGLNSICNVDELLRYFAVNTYLVNLDSYQSEKMQNYALYVNKNGYMSILPWDYNFSFGGYGCSDAEDMINFSISNPLSNTTLSQRPLLNVLLQNDNLKAKYEQYLEDCCKITTEGGTTSDGTIYEENNFNTILSKYAEILKTNYADDPTAFYTVDRQQQAITALSKLISLRSTAVEKQLNGDTTTVTSDINLNTIGDVTGGQGGTPGQGGDPGQGGQQSTLNDSKTNISVSGMFPPSSTLTVEKILSGSQYDSAKSAITDKELVALYNINVDNSSIPSGTMPSSSTDSSIPSQPSGTMPTGSADSSQPTPPDGGGQNNQSYTVSIPISNDYSDSVTVYSFTNNTLAEISAQVNDGFAVFTTGTLGTFIIAAKTTSDDILGDTDGDGIVDINDSTLIQKYLAGKVTLTDVQIKKANVDNSSELDINDVTYIQKYLAGKSTNLNIGSKI